MFITHPIQTVNGQSMLGRAMTSWPRWRFTRARTLAIAPGKILIPNFPFIGGWCDPWLHLAGVCGSPQWWDRMEEQTMFQLRKKEESSFSKLRMALARCAFLAAIKP